MLTPKQTADFWEQLRREDWLLVGFGELTGPSTAALFLQMGVPFAVSDAAPRDQLQGRLSQLPPGLAVFCGTQDPSQLASITQILVSPGVDRNIPLLRAAKARHIPIWIDCDLFYPLYAHLPIAAITGTDGKTTTTRLLAHIVSADRRVLIAGNLGVALASVCDRLATSDAIVLELSSFMLEEPHRFRANVCTVLNLAQDHVDRYPQFDAYQAAKRNLVKHCRTSDVFVRNLDDPMIAQWNLSHLGQRTVSWHRPEALAHHAAGKLWHGANSLPLSEFRLRGRHHLHNVLVATTMAIELGVEPGEALQRAATFTGLAHRFQSLGLYDSVEVIDDSKATTVQAVCGALDALSDRHVVLLLGGRDKGLDPRPLSAHNACLRAVVGYGEAGRRMLREAGWEAGAYRSRFRDAVALAWELLRPGDVLLLSPACTSFDQHQDYRERGRIFRETIQQISGASPRKP